MIPDTLDYGPLFCWLEESELSEWGHDLPALIAKQLRRERWGDRTLDLDLIAYGDVTSDTESLTLPHPRAAERDFVLGPWHAVDPDAVLPGVGRVADLVRRLGGEEQP